MHLNALGKIAREEWLKLPQRFPPIALKEFVIMQDIMHGIFYINRSPDEEELLATNPSFEMQASEKTSLDTPVLGSVVGAYKSLVMTQCLKLFKKQQQPMGKFWHRNYHERIIRGELAYYFISAYIINNPKKWEEKNASKRKKVNMK